LRVRFEAPGFRGEVRGTSKVERGVRGTNMVEREVRGTRKVET
jgi:hypothetical protein